MEPAGAYASLSRIMWSPMRTVFYMEPVGTTKACSNVLVPNSSIRIVTAHSAMKFRASGFSAAPLSGSTVFAGLVLGRVALDQLQCTTPARLGEEVLGKIKNVVDANARIRQPVGSGVVGPINDKRFADDVLARNESAIAAIQGVVAIVAHGEIAARRHHNLTVHPIFFQHLHRPPIQMRRVVAGKILTLDAD